MRLVCFGLACIILLLNTSLPFGWIIWSAVSYGLRNEWIYCGLFFRKVLLKQSSPSGPTDYFWYLLDDSLHKVLIDQKIIRSKGILVDGTVIPEKTRYPNDVGLLNEVREWAVKMLREIGKKTGAKIRTHRRKARKSYLNFSKSRRKSKRMIRRARREMLQYTRRNLQQLKDRLNNLDDQQRRKVEETLRVAMMVYEQQQEMHRKHVQRIENRIVSFWREYVRPIKRGKGGAKETEFGPKVSLSHVDGFVFVDEIRHENYSEADTGVVGKQVENYERRFGKTPTSLTGDQLYGSRSNRKKLEEKGIRGAFKNLGRKGPKSRSARAICEAQAAGTKPD